MLDVQWHPATHSDGFRRFLSPFCTLHDFAVGPIFGLKEADVEKFRDLTHMCEVRYYVGISRSDQGDELQTSERFVVVRQSARGTCKNKAQIALFHPPATRHR